MKKLLVILLLLILAFPACAEDEMDAEIKAGMEADGVSEAETEADASAEFEAAAEAEIAAQTEDGTEAEDESEEFHIREGVTWGMSKEQVLEAEGNPKHDTGDEDGLQKVEIENVRVAGAKCDIEYMFMDDALVMATFEYDTGNGDVSFEKLESALTERYGATSPFNDKMKNELSEEVLSELDAISNWSLDNGTAIWLMEDEDDHSIVVMFVDLGW